MVRTALVFCGGREMNGTVKGKQERRVSARNHESLLLVKIYTFAIQQEMGASLKRSGSLITWSRTGILIQMGICWFVLGLRIYRG